MKKLFRNLMLMAMTAITFTACEDVPAPYEVTSPGSTTVIPGGTGAGTVSDPYNAISALNLGSTLAAGEESTDYVYIKGYGCIHQGRNSIPSMVTERSISLKTEPPKTSSMPPLLLLPPRRAKFTDAVTRGLK